VNLEFNITLYDSFGNPFDFETLQQLKNFLNLEKNFGLSRNKILVKTLQELFPTSLNKLTVFLLI
jgi:hypothetical protein